MNVDSQIALQNPSPLDRHPAAVYLSQLGSSSRRTMRSALDTIAKILTNGACNALNIDWSRLGYQHTAALRSILMERYEPATANRFLAGLRQVLKEAWRLGQMGAEEYRRAADIPNIKSDALPAGRALSKSEITAVVKVCQDDPTPSGRRDAALIGVLRAGLRRAEVVNLDLKDINLETGEITILGGKGRKDRTTYLPGFAITFIHAWVEKRGLEPGPLMHPIDKHGHVHHRRLTDQAVLIILTKRAHLAGVTDVSPHDWRRTFVSDLLDAGVDISTVAKMAGHANITTTQRYDRRGETAKRKAADLLGF